MISGKNSTKVHVYSMPESEVDSGLHVITQEQVTMFMTKKMA